MGRLFGDEGQVESRVDFTAEFLGFVEVKPRGWDEIHQLIYYYLPSRQTLILVLKLACAKRTKLTLTN